MAKHSAGLLLFRRRDDSIELLLAHPGGPFWAKKDEAAWSIPKGEIDESEDPFTAAGREFREELGLEPPEIAFIALDAVRYSGGKYVHCWAGEADLDVSHIASNTFEMEWPPKSGRTQSFPEVDRAEWFEIEIAERKIIKGQRPLLDQLRAILTGQGTDPGRS